MDIYKGKQRVCVRAHTLSRVICLMFALPNTKTFFPVSAHTHTDLHTYDPSPSLTPPHAHTPQPTVSHLVLQVDVGAGGEQRCHHLHVAVAGGEVEGGAPVLQAAGRP